MGGSGGFTVGPEAENICGALVYKFLLTKIILQVTFRQNVSKLCLVFSDLEWIRSYLFADFSIKNILFLVPYRIHVKTR